MPMIICYRSLLVTGLQTSPGTVKADAVPELSPAQRRGENLALGLYVFMIVRIFFSTQILPDTTVIYTVTTPTNRWQEKMFTRHFKLFCLTLGLYFDHIKLVKG